MNKISPTSKLTEFFQSVSVSNQVLQVALSPTPRFATAFFNAADSTTLVEKRKFEQISAAPVIASRVTEEFHDLQNELRLELQHEGESALHDERGLLVVASLSVVDKKHAWWDSVVTQLGAYEWSL